MGIDGLGVSPRPEALARLLEIGRDEESAFRTHAAEALALQGEAAVRALAGDLKSADKKVRSWTLHTLSRIRVPGAVEALIQGLRDADPRLRALADFGLRRLSGLKDIPFEPQGSPAAREAAAQQWRERVTPKVLESK